MEKENVFYMFCYSMSELVLLLSGGNFYTAFLKNGGMGYHLS